MSEEKEPLVTKIFVDDIILGDRMRKKYENIIELATSIKEKGLIHPIVLWTDGVEYMLVVGGRRLRAYEYLVSEGFEEYQYIEAKIWPRELSYLESRQLELAENLDREDMEWTEEVAIKKEIQELQIELSGGNVTLDETAAKLGISKATLSRDIALAKAIEKSPALAKVKKKTDAQKALMAAGEAMIKAELARRAESKVAESGIDEYRKKIRESFIVGDAFDMIKKLPDESIDLIDLDPPYGIGLGDSLSRNEDGSLGEFHEWDEKILEEKTEKILNECNRVLKSTGWIIFWHSMWYTQEMYDLISSLGFITSRLPIMWIRPGKQGRTNHPTTNFVCDYEVAFYGRKKDAKLNVQGPSSIFTYAPATNKIHPTEKPLDLLRDMYCKFVGPDSVILSPFAGSGNGILAAYSLLCQGIGFDLSQTYKDAYTLRVEDVKMPSAESELIL